MRTLFGVIVIVFLASCRTVTNNNMNKLSSTAEKDYPLVLIAGGFNSCPSDGILDATMRAGKTSEMYDLYMNSKIPSLLHKIQKYQLLNKTILLCFRFTDTDCYYQYNPEDTLEIKSGGRWDRGKSEINQYVYIPIELLTDF